MNKTMAETSL